MTVTFDRDTKELCEDGWNTFICPHCRKTLSIDEKIVCVARGDEVYMYHEHCFNNEKESAFEEIGYDVSWGTGIDFID